MRITKIEKGILYHIMEKYEKLNIDIFREMGDCISYIIQNEYKGNEDEFISKLKILDVFLDSCYIKFEEFLEIDNIINKFPELYECE